MRRIMNISVPEDMYSFIRKRGESYCYSSVSEYIRALVRRDQFNENEKINPSPPPRRANDWFIHDDDYDDELTPENDTVII
jgi:Arc/MetJ-type ribon-helix-helix transcriptional regulator